MEAITLFDTTNYDEDYYEDLQKEFGRVEDASDLFQEYKEFEKEDAVDFIENFIGRYEKRYRTHVCGILLIAERSQPVYGNWNGLDGRTGYRLINSPEELFESNADDVRIYVDEDGYINADYFDHDGANYSMLKLIPESVEDTVYARIECDPCELDYAEFFQKKGQLKPTKFWQDK